MTPASPEFRALGTRVEGFLESLAVRDARFWFGARERREVAELLLLLAARGELRDGDSLCAHLAPLFCGDAQEQDAFRLEFRRAFRVETPDSPPSSSTPDAPPPRRRPTWLLVFAVFGLMRLGSLVSNYRLTYDTLTLTAPEPPPGPALRIPVATLTGRVLFQNIPVAGAQIQIDGRRFVSRADGTFAAPVGGAGGLRLVLVSHPQYGSLLDQRDLSSAAALEFRFAKRESTSNDFAGPETTAGPAVFSPNPLTAFHPSDVFAATLDGSTLWVWARGSGAIRLRSTVEPGAERLDFQQDRVGVYYPGSFRSVPIIAGETPQSATGSALVGLATAGGAGALVHARDGMLGFAGRFRALAPVTVPFGDGYSVSMKGEIARVAGGGALGRSSCEASVHQAFASPDESWIAHYQSDGVCVESPRGQRRLMLTPASGFNRVQLPFSSDSRWLLKLAQDGTPTVHEIYGPAIRRIRDTPVDAAGFTRDGRLLLASTVRVGAANALDRSIPWLAALLPLLAAAAFWYWLWRRRAQLRNYRLPEDLSTLGMKAPDADPAFQPAALDALALEMRGRKGSHIRDLDAQRTVLASIENLGLLTPQYVSRRFQREFLVLVERKGPFDQRWLHFQDLFAALRQLEVRIDLYWFQGSPDRTRDDADKLWLSIPDLAARHPDHDLWVVADPFVFADPFTGELFPWAAELSRWRDRVHLSPTTPVASPRLIAEGWRTAHASPDHLLDLMRSWEIDASSADTPLRFPPAYPEMLAHLPQRWLDPRPPSDTASAPLVAALRGHLGPEALNVLTACVVYPELHWGLTRFLATQLCHPARRGDVLTRLTSLPWFRYGRIPDWLRARLLTEVAAATEKRIREKVGNFIAALVPDRAADLRYGRLMVAGHETRQARPLRDYVMLEFLSGRRPVERETYEPPSPLRRLLLRRGYAVFGPRWWASGAAALVLAAAGWYAGRWMVPSVGRAPYRVELASYRIPSGGEKSLPRPEPYPTDLLASTILRVAESQLDEVPNGDKTTIKQLFPWTTHSRVQEVAGSLLGRQLQEVASTSARPGMFYRGKVDTEPVGAIEAISKDGAMTAIEFDQRSVRRVARPLPPGPYIAFRQASVAPPVVSAKPDVKPSDRRPIGPKFSALSSQAAPPAASAPPQVDPPDRRQMEQSPRPASAKVEPAANNAPPPSTNAAETGGVGFPATALPPGNWRRYSHFALLMDPARRMARIATANVDGAKLRRIARTADDWRADPGLPADQQPGEQLFANNPLDRGHLIGRNEVAWGDTDEEARQASLAVFTYANATPQHQELNQRMLAPIETEMLDAIRNANVKATILTGPIFSASDPSYRGFQIPLRFWRIYYVDAASAGVVESVKSSYRVPVSQIERATGLGLTFPGTAAVGFIVDQTRQILALEGVQQPAAKY